jgi:glutaredoxin
MSDSPEIILYTQLGCDFCDIMKNKLSDWGYLFQEVNISKMPEQKEFLRKEGHTTVPQLYVNGKHANKVDTIYFTEEMLRESL